MLRELCQENLGLGKKTEQHDAELEPIYHIWCSLEILHVPVQIDRLSSIKYKRLESASLNIREICGCA